MITGTTATQMRSAPHGAVYVWCNHRILYAQDLAKMIGRTDLRIIGPSDLLHWHGGRNFFVIDHAAYLTPREAAIVREHHL